MTRFVTLEIGCEYPDCFDAYEGFPGQKAATVRRDAKKAGWSRREGVDLCPKHTATEAPRARS